jgi:hypothetical protein
MLPSHGILGSRIADGDLSHRSSEAYLNAMIHPRPQG